ncbi:hypothetical protein DF186_23605, partial [Enterococcus hirae]
MNFDDEDFFCDVMCDVILLKDFVNINRFIVLFLYFLKRKKIFESFFLDLKESIWVFLIIKKWIMFEFNWGLWW